MLEEGKENQKQHQKPGWHLKIQRESDYKRGEISVLDE